METAKEQSGIQRAIAESNRLFPLGQAGCYDGTLHVCLEDGVFKVLDTAGCAELDPELADALADELQALDENDDDLYEKFADITSSYQIEGTETW